MEPWTTVVSLGAPTLVGGGAAAAWLALYPPAPKDLGGACDLDDEAERLTIPLEDGDQLRAWHLPGSRPASLLLLHGYGRTHHRMWRYAGFLRRAGYGLLTIDFRSSRRERRLPTTLGFHEQADAQAAWDALKERTTGQLLGVMGESLGGSVALRLAAQNPEVAAVVVDCPFATGREAVEDMLRRFLRLPRWPFAPLARHVGRAWSGRDPYDTDAVEAAALLEERPVLFIHSEADERLSPRQSERLWEAAGRHHDFWRVPGVRHNRAWLEHRAEYERRVLEFLERSLGA
jgi:dipeptidyl aminopeptidase/acylaminoacyl peptidase